VKILPKFSLTGRAVLAAICLLTSLPQTTMAQNSVGVPTMHAEARGIDAVRFVAAQKAKDALVLVVYGRDPETQRTALQAAGEARAAGYPVRGVILGPVRGDARSAIEFYADSQLTATFLNARANDKSSAVAEIRRGYQIIEARR
jgi:hypothetical protein